MGALAVIGLFGALFHTVNHGLFKSLLFLNAGAFLWSAHTQDLNKLGGLMKYLPATAATCLVASLSIAGVPFFNGFDSKWAIFTAAILGSAYSPMLAVCAVAGMFTSVLTLASFVKFFGASCLCRTSAWVREQVGTSAEVPASMLGPQVFLAAACLALGLAPALAYGLMLRLLAASRQGLGEVLAANAPGLMGPLAGLELPGSRALLAPLLLLAAFVLVLVFVGGLARLGGAPRRAAAPWLCGYALESDRNRYHAHHFYGEIKRWFSRPAKPASRAVALRHPQPFEKDTLTTHQAPIMAARQILQQLQQALGPAIWRADVPADNRLFVYIDPASIKPVCQYVFEGLKARYVISIGSDDRPVSGQFIVAHDFAFDPQGLLCCILAYLPGLNPTVDSISRLVPGANWAERELADLLGIKLLDHPYPKRLVLPDGWPEGEHPLRKDFPWNRVPPGYDENREFTFDPPPEGCMVVPFGPFHPTLDEPAHFRLYVEGEVVRGCEYRGFMVHRGIEKLGESVLTYNEIPMAAERICGICGCVHNVAYAQAVEQAAALKPPPRAECIRTIMLELERLHSHLLWVGLACHLVGFDTLFMQCFRIREPVMWVAEKISGNRKTYALCVIGGVRWDFTPALKAELRQVLDRLEAEWRTFADLLAKDRNVQKRTQGVGVTPPELVRSTGLIGPVARAAGVDIDCRRDHPYAAYDRVEFQVITTTDG